RRSVLPMKAREEQWALSWNGVWIAIPAYQEAGTIRKLAQEVLAHCPNVIVVDDGSTDGTAAQLDALPVTLLAHPENLGKAASLRTAFRYALSQHARCVIALDGDGQHDPADAPGLLAAWQRHPECIVIGSRLHDRAQFSPARSKGNIFPLLLVFFA